MDNLKPPFDFCISLLDSGFSLLTCGDGKLPNFTWKELQTKQISKEQFEKNFNYLGGHRYFSKTQNKEVEIPATNAVGIVTGYNNLEAIDVDCKVLSTVKEKEDFWNEFINLLKDNIEDFIDKFVIVKTRNSGYHIIYRCEEITGNKAIAKLENHNTCIIESRGIGGYIFIYQNFVQNDYSKVKYISKEDRQILWECCKFYNFEKKVETSQQEFKKVSKEHHEADVTVWQDFNDKNRIWDLISNEFTIVRKLSNKTVIKRNGATSPHSGYIFDNSSCMYLFSSATQYPHEKLLSAFHVYTIQRHSGDFSAAAKELYKQGYGSRFKPVKQPIIENKQKIECDTFPIEVFPKELQNYIFQVHNTLNASIDYLGCSMLWVLSLCTGNALKIEIKKGWVEAGVIWVAIVGKAGIGKTHNIQAITAPLTKINEREIIRYNNILKKYKEYQALDKKEKEKAEQVQEPSKTQFIVGDITLEAFFEHHEQNKNGIGILRDELSGWIKDLNKYREGSDLETYLSCWANLQITLNRKTAKSSFVPKAYVPIIGGVQPSILSLHYTPENKDNGFIDRWLLCYPDLQVEKYNENEMSDELIDWYSEYIIGLYDIIKNTLTDFNADGNIKAKYFIFSKEAKIEWIRIFNKITDLQNSEEENEYMKSILPKQKSYVARFALLLQVLYSYNADSFDYVISKKAILGAEKLSDYFIKMAKKNKFETVEAQEMKDMIKQSGKITAKEQFFALYSINKDINKTKIADQLNVSRMTINRWVAEIDKKV